MKKVYIKTFGCQMNNRDSEALMGLLLEKGYAQAQSEEDAEIILVNTCSVREHAEDRAISFLGTLKPKAMSHERPKGILSEAEGPRAKSRIVGLIGCMARNRGEELLQRMKHIDIVCGPSCLSKIPAYLDKIRCEGGRDEERTRIIDIDDTLRDEEMYRAAFRMEPDHAQVVISTGCSNYCSYCVVPYVRGNLRLRKPSHIVDEVKRNIDLGVNRVTLLGQNVNDYVYVGSSGKITFPQLLKSVAQIEGVKELNFITSQPRNTGKELFRIMADFPNIKKHLHLPFQSGSNRILKLMKRGYSREDYLQLTEDYRKIVGGTLSTDIIVGFPTENEKDFQQTYKILEKVRFKNAYIFKYSIRLKAASRKMSDDVTDEEKAKRHKILLDLQKTIAGEIN